MRFSAQRLAASLVEIPTTAWSLASTYANTNVHHGYRRVVLVSAGLPQQHSQHFDYVWAALDPVRDAWLSWIDPGGFIVPHRDGAPWRERWQVPIVASGDWIGSESFTPEPGIAFSVAQWESHAVTNRGSGARIHLVVDRDIPAGGDPLPFATFSIPADMADLVRRSQQ